MPPFSGRDCWYTLFSRVESSQIGKLASWQAAGCPVRQPFFSGARLKHLSTGPLVPDRSRRPSRPASCPFVSQHGDSILTSWEKPSRFYGAALALAASIAIVCRPSTGHRSKIGGTEPCIMYYAPEAALLCFFFSNSLGREPETRVFTKQTPPTPTATFRVIQATSHHLLPSHRLPPGPSRAFEPFVSIRTYSASSALPLPRTLLNASPSISSAVARRITFCLASGGSGFNTLSHVSRRIDSISSLAPYSFHKETLSRKHVMCTLFGGEWTNLK
jgi:hypothetical protein